jgi:hypothetical protein
MRDFSSAVEDLKAGVVRQLIMLEARDSIYVRRLRVMIEKSKVYISISKVRNQWVVGDRLAEFGESEALNRLKRWVMVSMAGFWCKWRVHKFFFEIDVKYGGVRFRVMDWGAADCPDIEQFRKEAQRRGILGYNVEETGNFYDDPSLWEDAEESLEKFKTISEMHAEALREARPMYGEPDGRLPNGDPKSDS